MNVDLINLFEQTFGSKPESITLLKPHASNRQIFRLAGAGKTVIGISNPELREHRAFIEFTRHFAKFGLPVPSVHAVEMGKGLVLEEDLGDVTLFDLLQTERGDQEEFPAHVEELYRQVVQYLPRFQIQAGRTIDYTLCYPSVTYDRKNMLWDMRYFRDSFLRRTAVMWQHRELERDFEKFADFLAESPQTFFMYRDFQSRNVMVRDGKPYFIDYQGGRRGPLQYDIASLLYQSRANLPADVRTRLLNSYLEAAAGYEPVDRESYLKYFHGFVFIRLMQVLGTYGEQGLGEKKEYFLKSIPHAVRNLRSLLETAGLPFHLPALMEVFSALITLYRNPTGALTNEPLKLRIFSFSYRQGVPRESSEHGGGFVFDCRCLPNPGREPEFRDRTGLEEDVIQYFVQRKDVDTFFGHVSALVDQAVENYIARGFVSLTIGFGCTGGQHRSVYCAERVAQHVKAKYNIESEIRHLELARAGLLPEQRSIA